MREGHINHIIMLLTFHLTIWLQITTSLSMDQSLHAVAHILLASLFLQVTTLCGKRHMPLSSPVLCVRKAGNETPGLFLLQHSLQWHHVAAVCDSCKIIRLTAWLDERSKEKIKSSSQNGITCDLQHFKLGSSIYHFGISYPLYPLLRDISALMMWHWADTARNDKAFREQELKQLLRVDYHSSQTVVSAHQEDITTGYLT